MCFLNMKVFSYQPPSHQSHTHLQNDLNLSHLSLTRPLAHKDSHKLSPFTLLAYLPTCMHIRYGKPIDSDPNTAAVVIRHVMSNTVLWTGEQW